MEQEENSIIKGAKEALAYVKEELEESYKKYDFKVLKGENDTKKHFLKRNEHSL